MIEETETARWGNIQLAKRCHVRQGFQFASAFIVWHSNCAISYRSLPTLRRAIELSSLYEVDRHSVLSKARRHGVGIARLGPCLWIAFY